MFCLFILKSGLISRWKNIISYFNLFKTDL